MPKILKKPKLYTNFEILIKKPKQGIKKQYPDKKSELYVKNIQQTTVKDSAVKSVLSIEIMLYISDPIFHMKTLFNCYKFISS